MGLLDCDTADRSVRPVDLLVTAARRATVFVGRGQMPGGQPTTLVLAAALLLLLCGGGSALDNGLALTPPMGWRSWNCYHGDVSQAKIEATVDAVVKKRGGGVSLLDLGFTDVGVDDGWQDCGAGRLLDNRSSWPYKSYESFHAADGTPVVNTSKFPDVKAMVAYGHKTKGLRMGWYNNNCMCCDEYTKANDPTWELKSNHGDIKFLIENDFDAVKIDNCGDAQGKDFNMRADFINASGKAMLIENSNQGYGNPQRGTYHGTCNNDSGAPAKMACPGCNNTVVKGGCGRGNPNNTLAPGWCPYVSNFRFAPVLYSLSALRLHMSPRWRSLSPLQTRVGACN